MKIITLSSQTRNSGLILKSGELEISAHGREETFVEQRVNYILEMDGGFIIIKNVPARVRLETGERLFSPETVERLQQMIWEQREPNRKIEVLVFEFASQFLLIYVPRTVNN